MIIEIAPTSPGKKQTRAGPLKRDGVVFMALRRLVWFEVL
jgi:hypothetical protein